jgi:Zn-dependent membrane protease YugP
MFFDDYYFLFLVPILVISLIAQLWITITYKKNSKISPKTGLTGLDAANIITEGENFSVDVVVQGGALTDHFDPVKDIVSLSRSAQKSSVSDIAVVAHEFGHVQQKFSNSKLFKVRNILVPVVNIGSQLGYILIIAGIFLSIFSLSRVGLILFSGTTIFALVTLPIEIDATKRGVKLIRKYRLVDHSLIPKAQATLKAAAFTYIASLLTSLLNLFYYISLVNRHTRRN